jgi:two-component system phosphate regulon sensor histidine kinase PhoR
VTIAKRLGLATIVLIALGVSSAYYVTVMALRGRGVSLTGFTYVGLGLIATAAVLVMVLFWRGVERAMHRVVQQLRAMTRSKQVGLVMADGTQELQYVVRPLNELLTTLHGEMDRLRADKRDLEIQSRIAAAEKHHVEAIIYSISDAVLVTNRFDELLLANEAAEKLLGFRADGSLRKNIDGVISDGTLVRLIRDTRSQGKSAHRKVVEHSISQKGEPRTYNITLSCVVAPNGEVSGVVAVLRDVTREKEIAQMKTEFVSNVSHELKTPLSSIKAYVEMLVDGEAQDDETRREFYDVIASEADRLNRLIQNILNISRIESGVVKANREPISLSGVVKQVLGVAAPQAAGKKIKLVEQLSPVYYQIEADQDMIYLVVLNLVSNAVKYTPDGGTVTVKTAVDEARQMAICEVADTGAGIPAADLPHVFDKFYRVRENNKAAKGTGLGLALVKQIIETMHDGNVSVVSEQGTGSTFSFELPVLS